MDGLVTLYLIFTISVKIGSIFIGRQLTCLKTEVTYTKTVGKELILTDSLNSPFVANSSSKRAVENLNQFYQRDELISLKEKCTIMKRILKATLRLEGLLNEISVRLIM